VRARVDTLRVAVVNVAALSAAWAWTISDAGPVETSST
jgi:hypothetical protein